MDYLSYKSPLTQLFNGKHYRRLFLNDEVRSSCYSRSLCNTFSKYYRRVFTATTHTCVCLSVDNHRKYNKTTVLFFNCGTHCVNAVNLHTYSILLFTKNTEVLVDKSSTHHFNSMFKIIQQTISLIINHTCVCSNCGRYHRTDCYVVIQTKKEQKLFNS